MTVMEEIQQLESLQTAVLREMFREIVGVSSRSNNRAFLTRRIAYVLQARAELAAMTSSTAVCVAPGTESRETSSAEWPGLDAAPVAPRSAILALPIPIPRIAGLPAWRPVYPVPAKPAGAESEAGGEPRARGGARTGDSIQTPSTQPHLAPTLAVPGSPEAIAAPGALAAPTAPAAAAMPPGAGAHEPPDTQGERVDSATDGADAAIMEVGARDPRIPLPGTVLVRHVGGRTVTVKVLERGFEYEGRIYSSLSSIAREVTGTIWNGLLFFGLVRRGERRPKPKGR
jgi:hypothetical protein